MHQRSLGVGFEGGGLTDVRDLVVTECVLRATRVSTVVSPSGAMAKSICRQAAESGRLHKIR